MPNLEYLSAISSIAFKADWSITFEFAKSIITKLGSSEGLKISKKLLVELKKRGPSISYTLAPFSVLDCLSIALILEADFHANTSALIITPATTATAKSSNTVIKVTKTITNASERGTTNNNFSEFQANVPITTINITPTNDAIGISSIKFEV